MQISSHPSRDAFTLSGLWRLSRRVEGIHAIGGEVFDGRTRIDHDHAYRCMEYSIDTSVFIMIQIRFIRNHLCSGWMPRFPYLLVMS